MYLKIRISCLFVRICAAHKRERASTARRRERAARGPISGECESFSDQQLFKSLIVIAAMIDPDAKPHPSDDTSQNDINNVHSEYAPEEPLPPEEIKPDPGLTPEEAAEARKKYLLKRFWISARGFWSRRGDALAWPSASGFWR